MLQTADLVPVPAQEGLAHESFDYGIITCNARKGVLKMMTAKELHDEFWLLTKGMLQDSQLDTLEAKVVKRWLEEHQRGDEFKAAIEKLDKFLVDGYIDRFESKELISSLGVTLRALNAN